MQSEPTSQDEGPGPTMRDVLSTRQWIFTFALSAFACLVALLAVARTDTLDGLLPLRVLLAALFLVFLIVSVYMTTMIVGTRWLFRRIIKASTKRIYVVDRLALTNGVRAVLNRKRLAFRTLAEGWGVTGRFLPIEMFPVTEIFRLDRADVFIIVRPSKEEGPEAMEVLIGPADGRDADLVVHLDEEIRDAMVTALSRR